MSVIEDTRTTFAVFSRTQSPKGVIVSTLYSLCLKEGAQGIIRNGRVVVNSVNNINEASNGISEIQKSIVSGYPSEVLDLFWEGLPRDEKSQSSNALFTFAKKFSIDLLRGISKTLGLLGGETSRCFPTSLIRFFNGGKGAEYAHLSKTGHLFKEVADIVMLGEDFDSIKRRKNGVSVCIVPDMLRLSLIRESRLGSSVREHIEDIAGLGYTSTYVSSLQDIKLPTSIQETMGVTRGQFRLINLIFTTLLQHSFGEERNPEYIGYDTATEDANRFLSLDTILKVSRLTSHDIDYVRGVVTKILEVEQTFGLQEPVSDLLGDVVDDYVRCIVDNRIRIAGGDLDEVVAPRGRSIFAPHSQFGLSVHRMIPYLYAEVVVSQGLSPYDARELLRDYLNMLEELEVEDYEKYPKHLRTVHDVATRNFSAIRRNYDSEEFSEAMRPVKNINPFMGQSSPYTIVVPGGAEDIIKEGSVLGHCVASYVRSVLSGTCFIVFLRNRDKPEEPHVTVEIRNARVTQARGKRNRELTEEETESLTYFCSNNELFLRNINPFVEHAKVELGTNTEKEEDFQSLEGYQEMWDMRYNSKLEKMNV